MSVHVPTIAVVPTQLAREGGGFLIRRAFPVTDLSYFDPILLIDELGPVSYAPGEAVGAPDHPHRGFETVTYVIEGAQQHEDSHGHRGTLRAGDVQWMTAGAGVIHSEMPADEILREGGRVHGFQIWVNLPRDRKMAQPRYQEYAAADLPVITFPGVWGRLIAGELDGRRSPVETTVPTTMLHVKLDAAAELVVPLAPGSNAIVHAINGTGSVEGEPVGEHEVALVGSAPEHLHVVAGSGGFEALVLAGVPLDEPVVRYGPFVMNTKAELEQAFRDYRAGDFGRIART